MFALVTLWAASVHADVQGAIQKIKATQPAGQGNPEAITAIRELEQANAEQLTEILEAMDDANPIALNWLRAAYETIVSRPGVQIPKEALLQFLQNQDHLPQARRLAYDTLKQADPAIEDQLIPNMLDDPSGELRRDAVEYTMKQAETLASSGDKSAAQQKYLAALSGAVDEDQVKKLADILKTFDHKVDLVQHYGFLTQWKVVGPFDNKAMKGFNVAYPPEEELAFDKEYTGMAGADGVPLTVKWTDLATDDEMGLFDVNKLFEKHMGATVYAATEFESTLPQSVEFRIGTSNAWKLWVNGELLFAREEYHRGMSLDQYLVRGKLKQGPNSLVLKLLQNEQTEDWAQDWSFQLRVCDYSGRAILPTRLAVAK